MGVTIAIILYADDAALPADSPEDLQLLASLFERYCNDNRLFIAVPKTFVTVFHPTADKQVIYRDNRVFVEGEPIEINIYGSRIAAAPLFKYLGVVLDSTCSFKSHSEAKATALNRAAHLLIAGLSRIPAYPHAFAKYLWTSLVKPVPCYGMDLFAFSDACIETFRAQERRWWRKLLQVGGRAPNAAVQTLFGEPHCDISWRVSRASLVLKLANAPAGSWQHLAILAHHHLHTPWFTAALTDLNSILPNAQFVLTHVDSGRYLSSQLNSANGGDQLAFHARSLPINGEGLRYRPSETQADPATSKAVKAHIRHVGRLLRDSLLKEMWSKVSDTIAQTGTSSDNSKLSLLAYRLQSPGPPLPLALNAIPLPRHRAALSGLLCGDFFLAKHTHNYFARQLLPWTQHHNTLTHDAAVNNSSVCLSCWHFRRNAFLEDEYHTLCVCPEYDKLRQDLLLGMPPGTTFDTWSGLLNVLSESSESALTTLGIFCTRLRQHRRHLKLLFERFNYKVETRSLNAKRAAWRMKRRPSCRHGVLFNKLPVSGCPCMDKDADPSVWDEARFMPCLDPELKIIVATPFDRNTFERLAVLQHRARALGW